MDVDEDVGNFNLCLTTDERLCLSVISQDDDAGVFISVLPLRSTSDAIA